MKMNRFKRSVKTTATNIKNRLTSMFKKWPSAVNKTYMFFRWTKMSPVMLGTRCCVRENEYQR